MMSRLLLPVVVLAVSGLFNACIKDDGAIPDQCDNRTGWLKPGHQWVYAFYSPMVYADTIRLTVNGEVRSGVYEVSTVADDTTVYAVSKRYMQPCGNDIYISSLESMQVAFVTYKVDGDVGEKWQYSFPTSRGFVSTTASEIVGKDVPVDVPAGTFNCLHIHEEISSTDPTALTQTSDYYIDNEYGLIRVVTSTDEYTLVRKNY